MAQNERSGWFKVYHRVLNDPKFLGLEDAEKWIWIELLCIASEYSDGSGRLPSVRGIAHLTRRSDNAIETVLERLEERSLIDVKPGGSTGSYRVLHDFQKWQGIKSLSAEDRQTRQTDTSNGSIGEKKASAKNSVSDLAWERFRKAYPKRDGDQNWSTAKTRFAAAIKKGVDPETIILGASRYRDAMERAGNVGERAKFVKQAATWLNQRTWEEYSPPPAAKPAPVAEPTLPLEQQPWPPPGISFITMMASARHCGGGLGGWPRAKWGPAPNEEGCRIPDQYVTEEDRRRTWREWDEVIADVRARREMTSGVM